MAVVVSVKVCVGVKLSGVGCYCSFTNVAKVSKMSETSLVVIE